MILTGEVAAIYLDVTKKNQIGGGFFWRINQSTQAMICEIDRYWFTQKPPPDNLFFKLFGTHGDKIDCVVGEGELNHEIEVNVLGSGLEYEIVSYDYHEDAIHDRLTFKSKSGVPVHDRHDLLTSGV